VINSSLKTLSVGEAFYVFQLRLVSVSSSRLPVSRSAYVPYCIIIGASQIFHNNKYTPSLHTDCLFPVAAIMICKSMSSHFCTVVAISINHLFQITSKWTLLTSGKAWKFWDSDEFWRLPVSNFWTPDTPHTTLFSRCMRFQVTTSGMDATKGVRAWEPFFNRGGESRSKIKVYHGTRYVDFHPTP